uniref:dnaJ homolog subfamily C member 17-like n=1 Tax=Erigeron canadensis TaxID=72917 RepID=UPI001CB93A4E|nr:dnaJ homolog subfamily C member 17-like [Erigeron canadensis]
MDVYIDHYLVLGLPSGEKGTKISYKDITKAYKIKALELHPDKKPNDPNAVINFQNLQASYEILKDENCRKKFDADLIRHNYYDNKQDRQHAAFEKRVRKRAAAAFKEREKKRAATIYEEREKKRAAGNKVIIDDVRLKAEKEVSNPIRLNRRGVDKENVLKVFWTKGGLDYSERKLREIFEKFGEVEDVIMSFVYRGAGSHRDGY